MTLWKTTSPFAGQLESGTKVSCGRSSGVTVASNDFNLAIEPSEVSNMVQPDKNDERAALKAGI